MKEIVSANVNLHRDDSPAETYAFALTVFSIVPYLGILFSLPAIMAASVSVVRQNGAAKPGVSMSVIISGCVILAVQVILWALLYFPPDGLGR